MRAGSPWRALVAAAALAGLVAATPVLAQSHQPIPEQSAAAEILASAYFEAVDGGDHPGVYRLYSQALRARLSEADSADLMAADRAALGALRSRERFGETWYENPPGVPAGVYAAFDYRSTYDQADLHCSYLILHQPPGGAFAVTRYEAGFIDREGVEAIRQRHGEGGLAMAWSAVNLNCPDG